MSAALDFFSQERFQGFKPGFARTQALLDALGTPERELKYVHVAGTNGKGSVCACLSSILTAAGYKTGLYTSPYVVCWNERVQVNGEYISDPDLLEAIEVAKQENDELVRVLNGGEEEVIERIAREKLGYAAIGERVFEDISGIG